MTTQLILWRIPRTASSSIARGIVAAGIPHMVRHDWDRSQSGLISFGHRTPDEVVADGFATREELRDTPSLTVVRNPWDRMVSLYHEYQQRGGPGLQAIATRYAPTFGAYVEWCVAGERHEGHHEGYFQARPQTEWLSESGAQQGHERVVNFDQLWRAWRYVKHWFPSVDKLPKTNHSNHKHYCEYFSPVDRDKVARFYAKDIDRGTFRFEVPHAN